MPSTTAAADDASLSKRQKAEMIIAALSGQTPIHEAFMRFIRRHQGTQDADNPLLQSLNASAVGEQIRDILAASLARELDTGELDILLRYYRKPHLRRLLDAARHRRDPASVIARSSDRERKELVALSESRAFHTANTALQAAIQKAKVPIATHLAETLDRIMIEHYSEAHAARVWSRGCTDAYQASDFMTAFFSCTAAAAHRCVECGYLLGEMYRTGSYPPRDTGKAREFHIRSAVSGHARSAHTLGLMTADAAESEADLLEAMHWLMLARELGSTESSQALRRIRRRLDTYTDAGIQASYRRFRQTQGIPWHRPD